MSTTPTSVGLPAAGWSTKQYAILIAMVLALMVGTFGVYSLVQTEPAATAPSTVTVEEGRGSGDGCSAAQAVSGGLVEGQTVTDACGGSGGSHLPRGVQP